MLLDDFLQGGVLAYLDIEIRVDKAQAGELGENNAHRTLTRPGHTDQADGDRYRRAGSQGSRPREVEDRHYPYSRPGNKRCRRLREHRGVVRVAHSQTLPRPRNRR